MALKAILGSLEGLPKEAAEHYVEVDGKYRLDVESVGGVALEDVSALKSALARERDGRRKAVAHLQEFGDYDDKSFSFTPTLDATKARDALAKLEKLKDAKPDEKAKAEREAWEKQIQEKHAKEIEVEKKSSARLREFLRREMIDKAALAALAKYARPDAVALMLPTVRSMTGVEMDGDAEPRLRVMGPDGKPLISRKPGSLNDMDIDELVGVHLREQFPLAYPGTGQSGSGATGADGKAIAIDPKMSAEQKLEAYHMGRAK